MQKIKKGNSGITLITLVITIIVLAIIISISIDFGLTTIHQVSNDKMESELSLIQAAIMQQYTILVTKENNNKIADIISVDTAWADDINRPDELIGTRLSSVSLITENGFSEYLINYRNTSTMTYEQYYYFLDESDLKKLKIEKDTSSENTIHEYIVNYSTGEVFDIANKTYHITEYNSEAESIYLNGANSVVEENQYNFTDE